MNYLLKINIKCDIYHIILKIHETNSYSHIIILISDHNNKSKHYA